MVTLPAPDVFAAEKQILDEPLSTVNVFVPSARPPAVQLVASVTSLPVVHVPELYPVEPTAAVRSGVTELLNSEARMSSADSDEYVVGAAVVQERPAIGLSIACWKMRLSVHA